MDNQIYETVAHFGKQYAWIYETITHLALKYTLWPMTLSSACILGYSVVTQKLYVVVCCKGSCPFFFLIQRYASLLCVREKKTFYWFYHASLQIKFLAHLGKGWKLD